MTQAAGSLELELEARREARGYEIEVEASVLRLTSYPCPMSNLVCVRVSTLSYHLY